MLNLFALAASLFGQEKPAEIDPEQVAALERMFLYHPRKYKPAEIEAFTKRGGARLDYTTKQGQQTAWLMRPTKQDAELEKLWVFCGGNGMVALEWESLSRDLPFENDAILLVDYPSYGACAGTPSPASIRENMKESIALAAKELKFDVAKLPERAIVFGASLGCAAGLMAVEEYHLKAAVLSCPFTTSMDMAQQKFGLSKTFPLQNKFDNRAGLKELAKNKGTAWIFHGERDEIIPVAMSKTLATEFPDTVKLALVPRATHNDIFRHAGREIVDAMRAARDATSASK